MNFAHVHKHVAMCTKFFLRSPFREMHPRVCDSGCKVREVHFRGSLFRGRAAKMFAE
jgi:hypothetical protein